MSNPASRRAAVEARFAPAPAANPVEHHDLIGFLRGAKWSSFAQNLVRQYESGRPLSARQLEAARNMKAKCDAKAAPASQAAPAPALGGFATVTAIMEHISASGNKWPRVKLLTPAEREVTMTYWAEGNLTNVRLDGVKLGPIKGAEWTPNATARGLDRDVKADVWALMQALKADAAAVFAENGKRTGTCACCGRPLSNDESVARGIGPECWAKFAGVF